jgi:phage-related protein
VDASTPIQPHFHKEQVSVTRQRRDTSLLAIDIYIRYDIMLLAEGDGMPCRVDYYHTARGDSPVKVFIDALPPKLQAKNIRELLLLEEFSINLPPPYAKQLHVKEVAALWELRVKLASDITRIFYFFPLADRVILLHGFVKKSDETPPRELQTAIRHMKDAIERGL